MWRIALAPIGDGRLKNKSLRHPDEESSDSVEPRNGQKLSCRDAAMPRVK